MLRGDPMMVLLNRGFAFLRQQPSLATRRQYAVVLVLFAAMAIAVMTWWSDIRLGRSDVMTGWTLLVCIMLLLLLGVRRRLVIAATMLRFGSVSTWTQIHLYTGLFAMVVYGFHVPGIIANGILESWLSIVFVSTSASGVLGLWMSRTIPRRLSRLEDQPIFGQIPTKRQTLTNEAETLVDQTGRDASSAVLRDFYQHHAKDFLKNRRGLLYLIHPTMNRRKELLDDLKTLDRYLDPVHRKPAGRLAGIIRVKDDLDYQFALQLRLRGWVIVHAFLSVALVMLTAAHVLIVTRVVG